MNWYSLAKLYKKTDAISTDYIDDLHNEDLRKGVPSTTEIIVYHGTSMKKFVDIMIHGSLDPGKSVDKKNYEKVTTGGIYITSSPSFWSAEMYAFVSGKNDQSDNVVIELVVPLGWIEKDPDDTRYNEKGEMNSQGKTQGYVRKPINIKRIRQIKVYNTELRKIKPNPNNDILIGEWTAWMPVGKFFDLIKRSVQKNLPLAPEYKMLVSGRPRGLSRTPPSLDKEQEVAEKLITIWHSFFEIGSVPFEKVLAWAYKNKPYDAYQGIQKFLNDMRPGAFEEFINMCGSEYMPRKGESFYFYIKRIG